MGNASISSTENVVTDPSSKVRNERHAFSSGHTLNFIRGLADKRIVKDTMYASTVNFKGIY
jgi:hypothetical protein